jgi:17beta-estradiol 17-dehydrogenase / very-long-chain 3-oxoacyl-CoA reductase
MFSSYSTTSFVNITTALSVLGGFTALQLSYRFLRHVYIYFIRSSSIQRYRFPDRWALLTGATGDMGSGFAEELCSQGFNVLLHGRNEKKLLKLQDELFRKHPLAKTDIVVFDAQKIDEIDSFVETLKKWHINVLVNNAGGVSPELIGLPSFKLLHEYSDTTVDNVIDLNLRFTLHLTRLLLPRLYEEEPSLIINISSSSTAGFPYIIPYSASKAFLNAVTNGLKSEAMCQGRDLEVMATAIANVRSGQNFKEVSFDTPTPRAVAQSTIARVGSGETIIAAYWAHALQAWVIDNLVPQTVLRKILGNTLEGLKRDEAVRYKDGLK